MKIESINVTALQGVLTSIYDEATTAKIMKLYALANDAMHAGYVAGYEQAESTADQDREAAWDRGYQAAEEDFDHEVNKLFADAEALDKEYKRLAEAYDDLYDYGGAYEDFYDDYDYDAMPDYIGDYYAKK
jgi:flagellar biosynthesis/type III secretory pathway protein FliH